MEDLKSLINFSAELSSLLAVEQKAIYEVRLTIVIFFWSVSPWRASQNAPRIPSSNVSNSPLTSDGSSIFLFALFSLYMRRRKRMQWNRQREIGGKLILIDEVVGLNIITSSACMEHQSARGFLLLLQGVRAEREMTRSLSALSHCVMTCSSGSRSSYFIYYIDKRWCRRREWVNNMWNSSHPQNCQQRARRGDMERRRRHRHIKNSAHVRALHPQVP